MVLATELQPELCAEFEQVNLGCITNTQGTSMEIEPSLKQEIQRGQKEDEKIHEIIILIEKDKVNWNDTFRKC